MTGRRVVRVFGVVALVLLAAAWGGPAGADDITGTVQRVGWWTDRTGAQPTIEPAKLEVSFGTDKEPTSVAAIDVAVPVGPVQTLQLSLKELAGTANGVGHVRVCLAAPGWATANAGALADAPSMDCANAADLTRSLDGSWLGEISGLLPDGGTASLGVILVNDLNLPITLGATVQISDIALTGQSQDGAGSTETTAPPVTTPDGGFDDSFVEPSPGFVPPAGSFEPPPLETPEQPAATTTTTAAPPPPLLPASFEEDGPPWVRLVILIPLALAIGFATVHGRRFLEARGISVSG